MLPICFEDIISSNDSRGIQTSQLSPCCRQFAAQVLFGDLAIARRRSRPQPRNVTKRLRVNDLIHISPIRLVDENNELVGVIEVSEAQQRARLAGLDLVEVAPKATPPVCRIMDYGKWLYQQKKKEQKARSHAVKSELKGMRLRPKIDHHDLAIKVDQARSFLEDSNKVQFTMIFRGREMAHKDLGLRIMHRVSEQLEAVSKIETSPRMMHRRMIMILTPDRKAKTETFVSPANAGEATADPKLSKPFAS